MGRNGSDNPETFYGLTRTLGNTTCMHGVPRIARSSGAARKTLWVILTLGGLGCLLWQSVSLIKKFYDRPVDTKVTLVYDTSLDYPMVSICNMNPLRMSSLVQAPVELQKIYGYKNGTIVDLSKEDDDDDDDEKDEDLDASDAWATVTNRSDYFTSHSSKHTQKMMQLYNLQSLNKTLRKSLGHNMTWLLLSCQYNGYKCVPSNFTQFFNPYFGNCYSFNSGVAGPAKKTSRPGPIYGLVLELYVEHDEYITDYSAAAGVKVVVGNQSDMPYPEDEGISVAVGTQTSIALSRMDILRAPPPHGDCHDYIGHEDLIRNIYSDQTDHKIKYSDRVCFKTCYQKNVVKNCGCCSPLYPCDSYAILHDVNFIPEVCNMTNKRFEDCQNQVNRQYEDGVLDCTQDCPPACTEVLYKSEISAARWPTKRMLMSVGRQLKDKVKKDSDFMEKLAEEDIEDVGEFLWNNVLKLEIFYRKLNYESVTTTASFLEIDLISDFGGQLGLWVGLSIVTIFEFIEYLVDLFILLWRKLFRRHAEAVKPSNN